MGRYGGEEYLVVLPGCETAAAALQAERLREAIAGTPFRADSRPLAMSCSIGLACSSYCAPEVLIREADGALYHAKANGRNRVVVHTEVPITT